MPATDLSLLQEAAEAAGEIALRHFRDNPKVWDKGDGEGPVTEADLAVNEALHDILGTARPDYGWLSEETEDGENRLGAQRLFIIDPIDGTRAFIDGSRDWAHSLAVVENGQVTAAVVAMPAKDRTYAAALHHGAHRDGIPITVADAKPLTDATVLAARPNLAAQHWQTGTPPAFKRSFRSSLAYRLSLVAEGRFDAMLTLRPAWEWDIAAGALIVAEAGGSVTDRAGHPLRFNNRVPKLNGVVAGGPTRADLSRHLA